MKKTVYLSAVLFALFAAATVAFCAYHHEGEQDSDKFLSVYPDKAGTKLDRCALCHSGGEVEQKGEMVSLGSCQWCHQTYGYDGSGNIIDTLNAYGKAYLINGRDQQALRDIRNLDSDEDGYTNEAEIRAGRYPGDDGDDPGNISAPYRVYSMEELQSMPQHTQFLLLNTSRSGDRYSEYTGVIMEDLLKDAGMKDEATGITVFAPDGWSNYHPLEEVEEPELYHVKGVYPAANFYYDEEADIALNPVDGWCDYSAPGCAGRSHLDAIVVPGGLRMILALLRDGALLDPGVLNLDNKLDGEGPFRVVPPQKEPGPPDQSSRAKNQDVIWPHIEDWDHNAGSSSRSATIIRVEPLPEGTTDIDLLEAGWNYVDEGKIIVYGAIDGKSGCDQIGWNGDITVQTVKYGGARYHLRLTLKLVVREAAGKTELYWKLSRVDILGKGRGKLWGECAAMNAGLDLTIPCLVYNGIQYRLNLELSELPSDPGYIYWKFRSITFR